MQRLILLIDDDIDEYFILDQALQISGMPYICIWAENPAKAVHLLKHIAPDLILIDFNMPKMNGIQCLTEIRKMNKITDVPVLIYSNGIDDNIRRQAYAYGASCLDKGSIDQTIHCLSGFLGDRKVLLAAG
ncbi:MAG: response regulator [Pseudobacter sp.]|uniref:response regulator n=1 Tax=Pseudobacter sp. TaxID=2045420 RepID=UPI003F7D1F9E